MRQFKCICLRAWKAAAHSPGIENAMNDKFEICSSFASSTILTLDFSNSNNFTATKTIHTHAHTASTFPTTETTTMATQIFFLKNILQSEILLQMQLHGMYNTIANKKKICMNFIRLRFTHCTQTHTNKSRWTIETLSLSECVDAIKNCNYAKKKYSNFNSPLFLFLFIWFFKWFTNAMPVCVSACSKTSAHKTLAKMCVCMCFLTLNAHSNFCYECTGTPRLRFNKQLLSNLVTFLCLIWFCLVSDTYRIVFNVHNVWDGLQPLCVEFAV